MVLSSNSPQRKSVLSLSRKATKARKQKNTKSSKADAAVSIRRKRSSSPHHLASLPIPTSFGVRQDSEIHRLENQFFSDDSDDNDDASQPPQKPKAAPFKKTPVPNFASCLHLDTDDDDDEDDLLAPPVFSSYKAVKPNTTTAPTTTAAAGQKSEVASEPVVAPDAAADDEERNAIDEPDYDNYDHDGAAAPWSADSKSNQAPGTSSQQLLECVDHCFRQANISTVTLKDIISKVERELSITVQPEQRQIIRGRVVILMDSPVKAQQEEQPSPRMLEPAVDAILGRFDRGSCTIKQVIEALEEQFNVKFTKQTKAVAKRRLIAIMQDSSLVQEDSSKADSLVSLEPNQQAGGTPLAKLAVAGTSRLPPGESTATESSAASPTNQHSKITVTCGGENKSKSKSVVECLESVDADDADPFEKTAKRTDLKRVSKKPTKKDTVAKETQGHQKSAAPPLKSKVCDMKVVVVATKTEAPEPKKRGRPRHAKINLPVEQRNTYEILPEKVPKKPAPVRTRKRARGSCMLCSNCPCQHEAVENAFDAMDTVQSDAAYEKTLINQLQKLEKAAERCEGNTDGVRRKLKKHRRDMWRKHEALSEGDHASRFGESRFLPDVNELNKRLGDPAATAELSAPVVQKAQGRMFSFAPTFQPTLTQMFGGAKKGKDGELDDDEGLERIEEEPMEAEVADRASGLEMVDLQGVSQCDSVLQSDEERDDQSDVVDAKVHRVEWKNGVGNCEEGGYSTLGPSVWRSLMTGDLDCGFDRLFEEDLDEEEEVGIDHLLGMLVDSNIVESTSAASSPPAASPVQMSMLSQRGQLLAEDILGRVAADAEKLEMLETTCPNWKENIIFALRQQETEDTNEALENVKQSRKKLARMKQQVLEAVQRRETVLSLFEDALQTSLLRMPVPSQEEGDNNGFCPTQALESPPRMSVFSEEKSPRSPKDATPFDDQASTVSTILDASAPFATADWSSQRRRSSVGVRTSPMKCVEESAAKTPESIKSQDTIMASPGS